VAGASNSNPAPSASYGGVSPRTVGDEILEEDETASDMEVEPDVEYKQGETA
jgi:hypothetical protein